MRSDGDLVFQDHHEYAREEHKYSARLNRVSGAELFGCEAGKKATDAEAAEECHDEDSNHATFHYL